MKKRYIVCIVLGVILVGLVVDICINNLYKLDERIFGVNADSYSAVSPLEDGVHKVYLYY